MIEFALFSQKPVEMFIKFLSNKGLSPKTRETDDCYLVCLPEDLGSELHESIDTEYDRLLTMDMTMAEDDEADNAGYHSSAIVVHLPDGSHSYATVNPAYMARIMEVLTAEEFGEIVNAIVDAVEQPETRTSCQKMRDSEKTIS